MMLPLTRFAKPALLRQFLNVASTRRAAFHDEDAEHATMNDLPIPEGDWKEHYSKQNALYNAVLASGLIALLGTIGAGIALDIVNYNYFVPPIEDEEAEGGGE